MHGEQHLGMHVLDLVNFLHVFGDWKLEIEVLLLHRYSCFLHIEILFDLRCENVETVIRLLNQDKFGKHNLVSVKSRVQGFDKAVLPFDVNLLVWQLCNDRIANHDVNDDGMVHVFMEKEVLPFAIIRLRTLKANDLEADLLPLSVVLVLKTHKFRRDIRGVGAEEVVHGNITKVRINRHIFEPLFLALDHWNL